MKQTKSPLDRAPPIIWMAWPAAIIGGSNGPPEPEKYEL